MRPHVGRHTQSSTIAENGIVKGFLVTALKKPGLNDWGVCTMQCHIPVRTTMAAFATSVWGVQCGLSTQGHFVYCVHVHECTCSAGMVTRYQKRISGPVLTRTGVLWPNSWTVSPTV